MHRTAEDEAYAEGFEAGFDRCSKGWQEGFEAGRRAEREAVEWQARRQQEEQARLARFKTEVDGKQIIRVGKYAYTWDGEEPLNVGDRVLLPGNWLFPGVREGTVTALGTDYEGELSAILEKLTGGDDAELTYDVEVTA